MCEINAHQVANGDNILSLSDLLFVSILGDKASSWLGCAVHGMRHVTREPMRPSGELENESEMTLELFGPFVKQSAVTSHSPTPRLDCDTMRADASSSKNPALPPSKRRRLNSE